MFIRLFEWGRRVRSRVVKSASRRRSSRRRRRSVSRASRSRNRR